MEEELVVKLMEVIRNSKKGFVRPKHLIWNGGTDRQTHAQTNTHTGPCIELRYAQLNMLRLRHPKTILKVERW